MKNSENNGMMTFGGHLEVLRQMIFGTIKYFV